MKNLKKLLSVFMCVIMLLQIAPMISFAESELPITFTQLEDTGFGEGTGAFTYLSDIEISDMVRCNVGWGTYTVDKNLDGNTISLKSSNSTTATYKKGVVAHANADLIYDLGENFNEYDKFSAFVGVDASRGSKGSVKFTFSVSNTPSDNSSWVTLSTPANNVLMRGNSIQKQIDVSINGYRYFRVVISADGGNEADHSVLADAKFYSEDYVAPTVNVLKAQITTQQGTQTLDMNEEFFENVINSYLQNYTYQQIINNPETELNVLRYDLVKKCGFENLILYLTTSDKYKERTKMFKWLFNDVDNLREFMNGGEPANGNYVGALRILSDLYNAYPEDLTDTTALRLSDDKSRTRSDLYKRMMFCMALVCSGGLQPWMANTAKAVPVNRYAYYKENYENNKMRDEIFENLELEEMRWVLGNNISDSEIVWLNDYSVIKQKYSTFPGKYSPHHLISYQWYDYSKDKFYSAENEDYYNKKYYLKYENSRGELVDYSKYGLTYGLVNGIKVQRVWMVFEDGAVCGNISRTGANLASCWGVPACESGQPGHCAFLIMNRNSNGDLVWGIDNNISGWLETDNGRRMPCNWGTWTNENSWINGGYRAVYVLLSQAALDDYDNYCKAEEVLKLFSLCKTNEEKETCLRAALSFQNFNLDAWVKLINLYTSDSTKTAHNLADLATELCSSKMVYQPRPLKDLMQLIINRLATIKNNAPEGTQKEEAEAEYVATVMRRKSAYYKAAAATNADCTQPDVARYLANNYLSGDTQAFATFSFDGNDAGKLVFNQGFTSVRFYMCFTYTNDGDDSNDTWIERTVAQTDESGRVVYALTDEELSQITAEGDIVIRPCGLPESPKNHFTIDITQAKDLVDDYSVTGMYKNDNENRFLGNVSGKEYSFDKKIWQPLTNDIVFDGDVEVYLRNKTSATMLASKNPTKFTFTDNKEESTFSYISIKRMTLVDFSTQEASKNDYASYAIDGIPYTRWHSGWWTNDTQRYVTIKLDEPTYFSGITYLAPDTSGPNGTFYDCAVYISVDGDNWYKASSGSFSSSNDVQTLKFSSVAYGQYVKIVGIRTHGNYASAREFSLYENTTFIGRTPETLTITNLPSKVDYVVGEKLDLTGIGAVCTFDNKSTIAIPALMLTSDTDVLTSEGIKTVYVKYLDLEPTPFTVNVSKNDLTPTSLVLETNNMKADYYIGEKFETDGINISASNGAKTWVVDKNDAIISVTGADENNIFTTSGEKTVSVSYKNVSKDIKLNVKELPTIFVDTPPTKTTYNLGETFDHEGMVVKITEGGETKELPFGNYVIDEEENKYFTKSSGTEKTLTIYLNGHKNVSTEVTGLTVYDYINLGNFLFEVDGETENVATLTRYSASDESVVNVPRCVYVDEVCYLVSNIGNEAFTQAEDVLQLILPDSVKTIESGAFSGLNNILALSVSNTALNNSYSEIGSLQSLKKLSVLGTTVTLDSEYLNSLGSLTNIELLDVTSAENVNIVSDTLPENVSGTIFVSSSALADALNEKFGKEILNDYTFAVINRDGAEFIVTSPDKTEYVLGETLDTNGFFAMLKNQDSTVEIILAGDCTFSKTIINELGDEVEITITENSTIDELGDEIEITVTENSTGLTDTFTIKVVSEAPVFTKNLPNSVYTSTELSVNASVNAGQVKYQWYYSIDTNYGKDDELVGENSNSFTVTKEGYYYTVATQCDIYSHEGKSKRSFVTHVIDPNRIKNTTSGEYFTTLAQAFESVRNNETLELLYDVYADSNAVLSSSSGAKNVTLSVPEGKKYSVIRTYTGTIVTINDNCTLNLKGVTIDGGAIWSGTPDIHLQRGTVNNGIVGTAPLIEMNANAKLNVYENTTIKNVSATGNTMYGSVIRLTTNANANTTLTFFGGSVENCYSPSNNCPGAIYLAKFGKVDIRDGLFKGNHNTILYNVSSSASPIDISGGTFINNTGNNGAILQMGGPCTVNITGGTFKNNKATNAGVIYSWNGGTININGGTFENNTAIKGGVFGHRDGFGNINLTISGALFKNNSASQEGGVIYYNRNAVTNISNSEFYGNTSGSNGGAIFQSMGVVITNCKFEDNKASNLGDSIYIGNVGDVDFALTLVSAEKLGEICIDTNRKIKINCAAFSTLGKLDENNNYVLDEEKITIIKRPGNTADHKITYIHDAQNCLTAVTDPKVEATCVTSGKTEGSHCGVCKTVIVAQQTIESAGSHSFGEWQEEVPAENCLITGTKGHYYCSACDKCFDENSEEIQDTTLTASHSYGQWQEEVLPPNCTTNGSVAHYTCSVCQKNFDSNYEEIEDISILATHSFGEWQEEVLPTDCKTPGKKAHFYCSVCEKYFDESKKEIENVKLTVPHTPGETIKEDFVAATCHSKGSYESVTYCTVCEKEIERQHISIPEASHTDENHDGKCEVCGKTYCTCGCHKSGFMGFLWKIGNFFNKLFKIKGTCACGKAHY